MKKGILSIMSLFFFLPCIAQITSMKVAESTPKKIEVAPYDSLTNELKKKDIQQYIGQELFVNQMDEKWRSYGYPGFRTNYTQTKASENIYKGNDKYNSDYESLVGRYFTVLDVVKNEKDDQFLKLQAKDNDEILYFNYNSLFNFVTVGYFVKAQQMYLNKEFVVRNRNWISSKESMSDITTGQPVSNFDAGNVWKCVGVTVEERFYNVALVLENEKGEQIPLSLNNVKNEYWIFLKEQADAYKKKYGTVNWENILNGKVTVGMTADMVNLALGTADSINESVVVGKKTHQFVYKDCYVFFVNGKVSSVENK